MASNQPLAASITSKVKNNHAYVTTQRILKKIIKIKFSVGCFCLFQQGLLVKMQMTA